MTTNTAVDTTTLQEQIAQMNEAMKLMMANQVEIKKLEAVKPKTRAKAKIPRIGVKQAHTNRGPVIRISTGATAISKAGKDYNAFLDVPLYQLLALETLIKDKDVFNAVKTYLKTGEPVAID